MKLIERKLGQAGLHNWNEGVRKMETSVRSIVTRMTTTKTTDLSIFDNFVS
jgi:hypothetical protein